MSQRVFRFIFLNLLLLFAGAAPAAIEKKSKTVFPDTVSQNGLSLKLTGVALRTAVLGIQVYAVAHYLEDSKVKKPVTPQVVPSLDTHKRLALHFLRKVSAEKMRESYQDSLKKNNPVLASSSPSQPSLQPFIEEFLTAISRSVQKNDVLELTSLPDKGLQITYPQQAISKFIASPEVAKMVWNIWFGPYPPDPGTELQERLVGDLQ